jgi:glycosyltransferase involved in cell wall biosynthesis
VALWREHPARVRLRFRPYHRFSTSSLRILCGDRSRDYDAAMIVLLLNTQNEAELLRWNIQHHLNWGFDHVAVSDNESTDDTAEVVQGLGEAVSYRRYGNFKDRLKVRTAMLDALRAQHSVDWVLVLDGDEFFWIPDAAGPRDILQGTPDDVVAVNFDMKLFLPTTMDPPDLPVFMSRVYRTTSSNSPLNSSYRLGKTFYRSSWLTRLTSDHWNPDVPHSMFRHEYPAIHHYMIASEDQFVVKVKRLPTSYSPTNPLKWLTWRITTLPGELPRWAGPSKRQWYDIYKREGEAGLRTYYRTVYTLTVDHMREAIADGAVMRDAGFAEFTRERYLPVGA